jgi:hypothetical protein
MPSLAPHTEEFASVLASVLDASEIQRLISYMDGGGVVATGQSRWYLHRTIAGCRIVALEIAAITQSPPLLEDFQDEVDGLLKHRDLEAWGDLSQRLVAAAGGQFTDHKEPRYYELLAKLNSKTLRSAVGKAYRACCPKSASEVLRAGQET